MYKEHAYYGVSRVPFAPVFPVLSAVQLFCTATEMRVRATGETGHALKLHPKMVWHLMMKILVSQRSTTTVRSAIIQYSCSSTAFN